MHAINALDLEPIKVKLMHEESGEGWTLERANAVEFEYRRFLFLMKKFPNEQTAPLVDVDTFWHYHILDTMKYAADCAAVFGHFLHHFPYIGLRGEDDEAAHIRVGMRMKELYEDTFGEDYVRQAEQAKAAHSGVAAASFAHSGVAGAQFAHSGVIGAKVAHSGVVGAKVAHSGVVGAKVAHSDVAGARMAHSGVAAGFAHSGVIGASALQAEAVIAAAQQSSFYSQRPRLTA
ncbi:glycine-rich domain-containing protein-like [Duganella radicis]|uniref:Glycine-rich domain-containing protein-like n=2 Tax=Duganella radicis TaxID=551988 RepID=A0A6L6PGI8_9BURK|nr:glycine-rich domain-containing protein-like [Duganella radicis]